MKRKAVSNCVQSCFYLTASIVALLLQGSQIFLAQFCHLSVLLFKPAKMKSLYSSAKVVSEIFIYAIDKKLVC